MNLASRKQAIDQQIGRLLEHAAQLERFPDQDPYQDGDVVRFDLTWSGGVTYTYAAIRAAGGTWYTTATGGLAAVHRNWLRLVEWMTSAAMVVSFEDMVPVSSDSGPSEPADPYGPIRMTLDGMPIYPVPSGCPRAHHATPHEPHTWASNDQPGVVRVCGGRSVPTPSDEEDRAEAAYRAGVEAGRRAGPKDVGRDSAP